MSIGKYVCGMGLMVLLVGVTTTSVFAQATQVRVETAADGSGIVVQSEFVGTGRSITVYAISRTAGGAFVGNVTSTWLLENITGGVVGGDLVPAGDGKSAVFTGNALGSATIRATSGGLTQTPSGTLTVVTPVPVFISPATKHILPSGGNFTVTVEITNAVNVHAFHVVFSLNNAYIRYAARLEGTFLNQGGVYSTFFSSNPAPGPSVTSVTVDDAILGPDGVTGDGTLFSITFAPVANGTSAISLDAVDLRDIANFSYPSVLTSGSVLVNNPSQVYVDPAYSAGNQGGHEFGYDGFSTLANGLTAVSPGGTMNIAPGPFNVTFNVNKNVTLLPMTTTPAIQSITLNTPSLMLGGNLQISNVLTLTSGYMVLGGNNLTLGSSGSISGASASSFIVTNGAGKFTRLGVGTTPASFPIGSSSTSYNPVAINTGTGTDDFSVRSLGSIIPPTPNDETAVKRTWDLSEGTIGGNGTIRFSVQWNTSHEGSLFNHVSAVPFRNTGGVWVADGALVGAISGSDPWVATVDATSGLSSWTIGNDVGLPIQLASFTGNVLSSGNVALTWVTLSEVNNLGFYVQRKRPAEEAFVEIPNSFIAGHGTTNETHTYNFTDIAPGSGMWMYRLRQEDLDTRVHYSEPIQVDVVTATKEENQPLTYSLKQNYPNPFNPTTTIEYSLPSSGFTTLKIFNLLGEEVASLVEGPVTAGLHIAQWNATAIPSGIYLCKLKANSFVQTRKLVLMK